MANRVSTSIFQGGATDPDYDADVVMTAALLGYCSLRLQSGKNCAFAAEAEVIHDAHLDLPLTVGDPVKYEEKCDLLFKQYQQGRDSYEKADFAVMKSYAYHVSAVARLNSAMNKILGASQDDWVLVDFTPTFGEAGIVWICGGTGDLSLTNHNRYTNTPQWSDACGKYLGKILDGSMQPLLYCGRGAYTGFSARQQGEPGVFSSYRANPAVAYGQRWIPTTFDQSAPNNGTDQAGNEIRAWGMIGGGTSLAQADLKAGCERSMQVSRGMDAEHMRFRDTQEKGNPTYDNMIVGYTHGMIQAIYDVVANPTTPGMPFEIGLKKSTTKLASCALCALFMQANKFPASSIHLGATESWAPSYSDPGSAINTAIASCNQEWQNYCASILIEGVRCMDGLELATDQHDQSLSAMKVHLGQRNISNLESNLILDAATMHRKQSERIVRTLAPAP